MQPWAMKEIIFLGKWTEQSLADLIKEAAKINAPRGRIDFLSEHFLNTPYKESTLIGDLNTPEVLVINLEALDCFTFLDYIEAMRRSGSFSEFRGNLRKVRYQSGMIAYEKRNHFFIDWQEFNSELVKDVTEDIGCSKSKSTIKQLNKKADGECLLPGILVREREVAYIPSDMIDDAVIEHLSTGDYIGIYSKIEGLDVSHVGIIIKKQDKVLLRHASQKYRKVIDEDFRDYLKARPGIVVLRPQSVPHIS